MKGTILLARESWRARCRANVLGDRFVRQGEYSLRAGVVLVLYASRDLIEVVTPKPRQAD